MWVWGRPKRDLPPVNYAETSSEDEFDLPANAFKSPLRSPQQPVHTREGSPQLLAHPTLNDNVDEVLEEVSIHLADIQQVEEEVEELALLLEETDTKIGSEHSDSSHEVEKEHLNPFLKVVSEDLETSQDKSQDIFELNIEAGPEAEVCNMPDQVAAAVPYDTAVGEDGDDVYKSIATLKLPFSTTDPKYWFSNLERKLKTFGVGKQKTKKDALHAQLPIEVENEVKNYLRLEEDEEGETPYKDLKVELIKLYQPKPEDAFDRALARVMTGKPSTLAKEIINDLCDCRRPLSTSCCAKNVFGMWRRSLPHPCQSTYLKQTFQQGHLPRSSRHC